MLRALRVSDLAIIDEVELVLESGFNVLTRAMTADIADEIRLEKGKERSGLLYAITTMTTKVAGAFSIGLTFLVLSQVGYNAGDGAANSAHARTLGPAKARLRAPGRRGRRRCGAAIHGGSVA